MKKIYISGRVKQGIEEFAKLADLLEVKYEVTLKWWDYNVQKPYLEYAKENIIIANKMIEASKSSDIFVLFHDDSLLGASTEFGVALASEKVGRCYLVGINDLSRQSIFYTLPKVKLVSNTKELLEDLGIKT